MATELLAATGRLDQQQEDERQQRVLQHCRAVIKSRAKSSGVCWLTERKQ